MGALTKQERDGLEDIFLSIHTSGNKETKLSFSALKILKMAKIGLKESKISQFITLFIKKKKNLSK